MRFLCLLLLAAAVAADQPAPEVATTTGRLRGKWSTSQSGRPVAAFEGVPYAKPPVGALRFQPPAAVEPWSGVKDAVEFGPICMQRNIFLQRTDLEGSEDCLYLNVYTPETVSRAQPLPTMVFIHGGGYFSGAGSLYTHELMTDRDIVLVTFNYRLGPLGFLSTGDGVLPGNYGMKDQVAALRWVRDNIRAFGGDPDKVTIFGESAGGASTHLLVLSPLAKGLFHRAIPMSGTALTPWAYQDPDMAHKRTVRMAKSLQCATGSSEQIRECVMAATAEQVQGVDLAMVDWMAHPMCPFRPTAEPAGPGAFLDRHPREAYAAGLAADVPFMTGFTSHEGCIGATPLLEAPGAVEEFDKEFDDKCPVVMLFDHFPVDVKREITSKVRKFYFGDKSIGKDTKWELVDLMSDMFFIHSSLESVKLQKAASKSPLFLYRLAHTSHKSWALAFGAKEATYGVCHADDLLYLFPLTAIFPQEGSPSDKAFSKYLVDLFTTFADIGRPTRDASWQEVKQAEKAEYMDLTEANSSSMKRDFEPERVAFWSTLPVDIAFCAARAPTGRDEL